MTTGIQPHDNPSALRGRLWSRWFGFTTADMIETHFLPYASFFGFPLLPSTTAYGVLSAVNLDGMILAGHLGNCVYRPTLLGSVYLIRAASFILLLYLFVVLCRLVDCATMPVAVGLATSHSALDGSASPWA